MENIRIPKRTVLLIDDDLHSMSMIKKALKHEWNIVFANEKTYIQSIKKACKVNKLCLILIRISNTFSCNILNQIRSVSHDIPIIAMTHEKGTEQEIKCLKNGAVDFIGYPFSIDVLVQRINYVIHNYTHLKNLRHEIELNSIDVMAEQTRLKLATYQMLNAFSRTIDAKDFTTNDHSKRVAIFSHKIAKDAGFSKKELDYLYQTALLHDIGKIGIADDVLRKPTKLSEKEYQIIKNHTIIGYNILKDIDVIPEIAYGARWHHERFDGNGYPDGLAGKQIPLVARIICLADSIDAMLSERPYKKAMPFEFVKKELLKCSGQQFDPDFVPYAIDLIDDLEDEKIRIDNYSFEMI